MPSVPIAFILFLSVVVAVACSLSLLLRWEYGAVKNVLEVGLYKLRSSALTSLLYLFCFVFDFIFI